MSIIGLIIVILVIGLAFWANNTYVTPGLIRTIVNIVLIIICLIIVLRMTGTMGSLNTRIGAISLFPFTKQLLWL